MLAVQSLALNRGDRRLFQNLSFSLEPGQLALVRGANGAGKTTLLRALVGLVQPSEGSILAFGSAVKQLTPALRRQLLYLGHAEGLKQDLSVSENLAFWRALDREHPVSGDALDSTLSAIGLAGRQQQLVRHLSAGQRRRAVLARLHDHPADLWLLDEPLTNLDGAGRAVVETWLSAHLLRGGAAVVATHTELGLDTSGQLEIQL